MIGISRETFLIIHAIVSIINTLGTYLYCKIDFNNDRRWFYVTGLFPIINIFVCILIIYGYLVLIYNNKSIKIKTKYKWYYDV